MNRMVSLVQIDPQKILVILCALRPLFTRYSPLMRTWADLPKLPIEGSASQTWQAYIDTATFI